MTDTFNVTASYDKAQYNSGDTMTINISGGDVLTQVVQNQTQSGSLSLTITAADGAVTSVPLQSVTINSQSTTTTPESVKLTGIADSSGRVWTINANGLSATAIA
jgi:hypothetical protein